jgi:hypothetical protein
MNFTNSNDYKQVFSTVRIPQLQGVDLNAKNNGQTTS